MIDLSLAGLMGATIGVVVAAVVYYLFIGRLDEFVQARIQATPAEERGDLSLSIVRRIALTLDLVVFVALGYWLGQLLGA
jgi:small-conductance mechanosensitive channel